MPEDSLVGGDRAARPFTGQSEGGRDKRGRENSQTLMSECREEIT